MAVDDDNLVSQIIWKDLWLSIDYIFAHFFFYIFLTKMEEQRFCHKLILIHYGDSIYYYL